MKFDNYRVELSIECDVVAMSPLGVVVMIWGIGEGRNLQRKFGRICNFRVFSLFSQG